MSPPGPGYRWQGRDLHLELWVRPGARRDALEPARDGAWVLRIAAPARGGEANRRLVRVLARAFRVPQAAVLLTRGAAGRRKKVVIRDPGRLPPEWGLRPPNDT